jgi:UDP-N-acetylmuramyl pentapeptide phosphotransferase/UDP-N-acetylglucosamine-1-phosphate transferase
LLFATILTLYVIPAVYAYLSSNKANKLLEIPEEMEDTHHREKPEPSLAETN